MDVLNIILEIAKFLALLIATFYFMKVLTNEDKKLSIVGTILVCCSSFIFYKGIPMAIIFGELAIISLDKFFTIKNKYLKVLFVVILFTVLWLFGAAYSCGYYTNYMVNGFTRVIHITYLALAIWLIIKNTGDLSKGKRIALCFLPIIISVVFIIITEKFYGLIGNSILDLDNEKNGFTHLFSYGYSMFLPFVNLEHNELYSSFLSLFPVSLIVAMIYVYKEEKHTEFFMPMIIAITLESVYCMTKVPILKIFGFDSSMYYDFFAGAIGLSCVYLYMYMLANIDEKIFSIKSAFRITIAFLIFYFLIPKPTVFNSKIYMYVLSSVIALLYFLFLNFGDSRYKKVLVVVLVIWTLISSVAVYPMKLIKGKSNEQENIVQEQAEENVN